MADNIFEIIGNAIKNYTSRVYESYEDNKEYMQYETTFVKGKVCIFTNS